MAKLITENGKLIIRDEWHEEDIQHVAEYNFNITLTPEQTQRAMEILVKSFDASIGISWDTIYWSINQILDEKVSL